MKVYISVIFLLSLMFFSTSKGFDASVDSNPIKQEPLIVSLGSICSPAMKLKGAGLRTMAFPLDWVLSLNGEKVVELIEDGFSFFTDERYLKPHPTSGILLHHYYHIEFSHEENSQGSSTFKNIKEFQVKYQRRVERFKQLGSYSGKVYFLRVSWTLSQHQNYVFANKENLEISSNMASRLFQALKKAFPALDCELIIINSYTQPVTRKEEKVSDHIRIISCSESEMGLAYNELFAALKSDNAQKL